MLQNLIENNNFLISEYGRNDSPGHRAQYCTYTMMDDQSKKIISLITMDKRETGKKSCKIEKTCFMKSRNDLLENHINIEEVVTDAHIQIGAVMSKSNYYVDYGSVYISRNYFFVSSPEPQTQVSFSD